MAKAFFRWLRGELNGFYVTNINGALNESTKDVKDFLSEFKAQLWRDEVRKCQRTFQVHKGSYLKSFRSQTAEP